MKYLLLLTFSSIIFSVKMSYGKHAPENPKKHVFKINGKITYKNNDYNRGLYGATVVLHMLKKGDSLISSLTGSHLNSKDLKVSLLPDGSFSFNLQILSNLAEFDRIFLEIYPGDTHSSINYDSLQYISTSSVGKIVAYNKQVTGFPFRGIELPFDNNQINHEFHNIQIEVMPNFGGACRYLKIANEFGKWFFKKINKNISIPPITARVVKEFDNKIGTRGLAGYFWYIHPLIIELKFSQIDNEYTTAHEYGHYLHYLLNKKNFSSNQYRFRTTNKEVFDYFESLADFFSMAIRKYAEAIYADIPTPGNNFERLPFDAPTFENCGYCVKEKYTSPRWASYLWNIFDGPSQNFDKEGYSVRDNDDIDGEKEGWYKEIFNIISGAVLEKSFMIKSYLHDPIKMKVGKDSLILSLDRMYSFLFKDIKCPFFSAAK